MPLVCSEKQIEKQVVQLYVFSMAEKKGKSKNGNSPKASRQVSRADILNAALVVASRGAWEFASPLEIAALCGVSVDAIQQIFPTKQDMVHAIVSDLDAFVLAGHQVDEGISKRDRLFDVLMDRFDAMNDARDAHISFIKSYGWNNCEKKNDLKLYFSSLEKYARISGLETKGLFGPVRVLALGVAYAWVLSVWMRDETSDISRTMSALDRALGRLEWLSDYIQKPASV